MTHGLVSSCKHLLWNRQHCIPLQNVVSSARLKCVVIEECIKKETQYRQAQKYPLYSVALH